MLKTPLYSEHCELKGQIVPFAGWLLPVQYTSIKEEVLAVRNHCGLFDVSHMGEFIVEGKDARKFVNFLICNDIETAPIGKAIYSPLLNYQGKCIDDLIVYILSENRILLCVNASNIEKDWNWINEIAKKTHLGITLTNCSNDYSLIALQGPQAENILSQSLKINLQSLPYYGVMLFNFEGSEFIIARTGYTGEDGFEIFLPNKLATTIWKRLLSDGARPCGLGARDCLRVEVAYPLYGHEINEGLTPLDSGLKWTVKFKKNDFIGKNALEVYQLQFKQIKFLATKGIPRDGYELKSHSGENVGKVSSGTLSPTLNRGIGLGLVRIDVDTKEQLYVDIRGQLIPIEVVQGPFVKGGHK